MVCLPRPKNAIRWHYSLILSKDTALKTSGQALNVVRQESKDYTCLKRDIEYTKYKYNLVY